MEISPWFLILILNLACCNLNRLLPSFCSESVLFFLPVAETGCTRKCGEALPFRLTVLQVDICFHTFHPPTSLRLPSLFLQLRRRPLLRHIPLLHICCPERGSNSVRKCEKDTRNGHQFQQDSGNTEANVGLSVHIPDPIASKLVPLIVAYLVYAALYSSICFCLCVLFHCFNWKYLE